MTGKKSGSTLSLKFEELSKLIACRLHPAELKGTLGAPAIDTRLIKPGEVFWALAGDQVDGHAYVAVAFAKGAQAAVVSRQWFQAQEGNRPTGAYVVVEDPLTALQELAAVHRQRYKIPLIALTGSNGKTATKELLGAALSKKYRVLKNAGNFNNHIGVPLTLLGITDDTEIILTEMGTNHPGEIEALCRIARPSAGLVLNVGPAHLEGFGDVEAVAREKGSLLQGLPKDGAAFVNLDDPFVRKMTSSAGKRIGFGFEARGDNTCTEVYMAEKLPTSPEGKGSFQLSDTIFTLNWPGPHQVKNALAAAVVAQHFGMPLEQIVQAFAAIPPLKGRLQTTMAGGVTIIDDSYNANPASTGAALEFLASLTTAKRRFAVLGDNLELGQASEDLHRGIGAGLKDRRLQGAFLVGTQMAFAWQECAGQLSPAEHYPAGSDYEAIADRIVSMLKPGDAVLVKASRGMGLDRIARGLINRLSGNKS